MCVFFSIHNFRILCIYLYLCRPSGRVATIPGTESAVDWGRGRIRTGVIALQSSALPKNHLVPCVHIPSSCSSTRS